MEKQQVQVYLVLGSNLGDRKRSIEYALKQLKAKIENLIVSPIYETVPWGVKEQPVFLNVCVGGETELRPNELLKFIKDIERKLSSNKRVKWGPAAIDIDILFYGDEIIHKPDLVIPQPYLADRVFALVPLADIAPDFIHPELKYSIKQMLKGVDLSQAKLYKGH